MFLCSQSKAARHKKERQARHVPRVSQRLIRHVANARGAQGKVAIVLGQGGTVENGAYASFPASLAHAEARGGGVRHDVAANGLGAVLGKAHAVCVKGRKS